MCSFVSLIQIISVLDDYFGKKVNRYLSIVSQDKVELPWFSVCFEILYFKPVQKWTQKILNKSSTNYSEVFSAMDGKFTLRQLYHLLPKKNSLFSSIEATSSFINGTIVNPSMCVNPYFYEPFYCFAIGSNDIKPHFVAAHEFSVTEYGSTFLILHLSLKPLQYHKYSFLMVHPHRTLIHEATSHVYRFNLNNGCAFVFEKIRHQLLPSPFETNCINYESLGYRSQSNAIEFCNQRIVNKIFNRNLPYTSRNVLSDSFLGYGWSLDVHKNYTKFKILRQIKKHCANKYFEPDCEKSQFNIVNFWILKSPAGVATVKMKILNTHQLEILTNPRHSFTLTIYYLGSILGIWFGFSITFDVPKAFTFIKNFLFKKVFTLNLTL